VPHKDQPDADEAQPPVEPRRGAHRAVSDPTIEAQVVDAPVDPTIEATVVDAPVDPPVDAPGSLVRRKRVSAAGAVIGLLVGLLAFALVVQVKSNTSGDTALENARQDDLVRILSDLNSREQRQRDEISTLQNTLDQLGAGAQGRDAALAEAKRRADELAILAGTVPAQGQGLIVTMTPAGGPVHASTVLEAVEELRGAGAEAMQITDGRGTAVRIVASTYFIDNGIGILVDATALTGTYRITVIGPADTMRTALTIPGGVADSVARDGGTLAVDEPDQVTVTALHPAEDLQYAKPEQ
jgi:uncharacterized protein YlxW (UPF0749 family)